MRTLIAAALLLVSSVAPAAGPVGIYQTVSESEWEIQLELKANHSAKLITSRWEPGERDHATVTKLVGKWRIVNDQIETTFKKSAQLFTFEPQLSFKEIEKPGSAPGLVGVSGSIDFYKFAGMHFWSKSELAKVKW